MSVLLGLSYLCLTAEAAPFLDYGVGSKVAECRGLVLTRDAVTGHDLALALALDESARGYLLVTDLESGTTQQCFYPAGVSNAPVFASLLSQNGRFYTGAGKVLLEFDPTRREWLFHGVPQPAAANFVGQAMADGPDGLVYVGTYPNAHLVSYDPKTQAMRDYGQIDPREQYFNYLAFDDAGWAYAGIGTARADIVAFHPPSGERHGMVAEAARGNGTGTVYRGTDGKVYGQAMGQWYRLHQGIGEKIERAAAAPPAPSGAINWGQRGGQAPSGRKVLACDLAGRVLTVEEQGQRRQIALDYEAGGVMITSLASGPDGRVYASSAHPMHLIQVDPARDAMVDLGAVPAVGGGNFCAMAAQGPWLVGGQYSHGRLWAFDTRQPFAPDGVKGNPRVLAEWPKEICRPRTTLAHPDGRHVMTAGFANYGLVGGGLGIVDLETGQAQLLTAEEHLLAGQSIITLEVLPNGDLIGGTSTQAPGGGHTTAKQAELLIIDWAQRQLAWHEAVLPDQGDILSLKVAGGLVYGLTASSRFFVFDPTTRRLLHQESYAAHGGVPRHAFQLASDGQLYVMLAKAILRLDPQTYAATKLAEPPTPITAGGAASAGSLYCASGAHLWRYRLPAGR